MSEGYITLNAGSSSIKFSIHVESGDGLDLQACGSIEEIRTGPHFAARDNSGRILAEQRWDRGTSYSGLLAGLIAWIEDHIAPARLAAVGHRVVHGGGTYSEPVLVTPEVLDALARLHPLAPLHQPHNLQPIRLLAQSHPDLPQVACFDTSFHATNPPVSRMYALPRRLLEQGIMRYGFHGLSYEYIADELARLDACADGRVIVAHLGNGASMCAMVGGRSVASTMGFSALAGLPMGTRSGDVDPGTLLYLLQEMGMSPADLENLLYRESGLLGVSGTSSDMRTLLRSSGQEAREAIDLFVYRIVRELGSLAAAAGGIDSLVFTGGIGEHAPEIRAEVCAQAGWLGIEIDHEANAAGGPRISSPGSRVSVWALPTDEESVIARHTRRIVRQAEPAAAGYRLH